MSASTTGPAGRMARGRAVRAVWTSALVAIMACGGDGGRLAAIDRHSDATAACAGGAIAAWEGGLVEAYRADRLQRGSVEAYLRVRDARAQGDEWGTLWRELRLARGPALVIAVDTASAPSTTIPTIRVGRLPAPEAITSDELLLAIASASGVCELFVAEPGHTLRQLFARDPLAPFVAALPAVVGGDVARVDDDAAIAASVRRAIEHAGALRYVEAASEAARLAASLDSRGPDAATLRGRFALSLLTRAGLVLDTDGSGGADATDGTRAVDPPEQAGETAYVAYLRVRMATDDRVEWAKRRDTVLAAIRPDRREAFDTLHGKTEGCVHAAVPPPIEGPEDLVFGPKLAAALDTTVAPGQTPASGARTAPGMLDLEAWLPRYEAFVAQVVRSKTFWAYAAVVLFQRGSALRLGAEGSPTYRQGTDLGLAHLVSLRALAQSAPLRWRGMALLPLAYGPGVVEDERLREAVVALSQTSVQDQLARSTDAQAVAQTLLTGLAMGLSYPPAIQAAHFVALQGAFTAKLRGDLAAQRGWAVAGLYAADAAYRIIVDEPRDLSWSAEQIARALAADPALSRPALAALAATLSRYAALALSDKLGAPVPAGVGPRAPLPADRLAARASLSDALRGLGAEAEVSRDVLGDVVELVDGTLAAFALRARGAPTAAPAIACARDRAAPPTLARAVAKLADVRRRIFAHPRFRDGDGGWIRRVRPLVAVASDALDLLATRRGPVAFELPADRAADALRRGLGDFAGPQTAEGIASLYAVVRRVLAARSTDAFFAGAAPELRGAIAGLAAFFRDDAPTTPVAAASRRTLVETLAALAPSRPAPGGQAAPSRDASQATEALSTWARELYALGERDHGDLLLLAAASAATAARRPPPAGALELAAEQKSRVAWALLLAREIATARSGGVPDPSRYEALMRQATDDACSAGTSEAVIAAMNALRDYAAGKRDEARAGLDRVLDRAEQDGLVVPKMSYRYEEKTRSRVFSLTVDMTYGMPFIAGGNTLQLGVGLRAPGPPEGALTARLAPTDTAQASEDAAKLYVELAALATAWHLQAGDRARASAGGSRLLGALVGGVRLGRRSITAPRPVEWMEGSRGLWAIDAQLAAEAGMPLLAGDLWTILRASLPSDADDSAIDQMLAELPFGLGSTDLAPVVERAKASMRILAAPLACTHAKIELGGLEEPACDRYSLAVSLRVADVLPRLPRLRRADAARCPTLATLDAFLGAMDRKTYDPDAFARATRAFERDEDAYEAAVLLTRQRSDAHCSAPILASARALGRSSALGAAMRADVLSVALSCAAAQVDAPLLDDIDELDAQARRLADRQRSLALMLFVSDLAVRSKRWDVLGRVAGKDDFVTRWLEIAPTPAAAALLVRRAWAILAGGERAGRGEDSATRLLCDRFPSADRAQLCATIQALRLPSGSSGAAAEKALTDFVASQRR